MKLVESAPIAQDDPSSFSLDELLSRLTAADEGALDLDLDQQKELVEHGQVKVDNYKYIDDKMKSHVELLDKWAKEFADAKKVVENRRQNLRKHLVRVMQSNKFEKYTGKRYVLAIQRARSAVDVKAKPDAMTKLSFPNYVRVEYKWNLEALGDAIRQGDEEVTKFASLVESWYPKYTVAKGV